MTASATPHNFLLYLRTHAPSLARRMDGVIGLERRGPRILVRTARDSWCERELHAWRPALQREAELFFGPDTEVDVVSAAQRAQALPMPALTSKVWNHLAFVVAPSANAVTVLTLRKPLYLETWLPRWAAAGYPKPWLPQEADATYELFHYRAPRPGATEDAGWVRMLPEILDDLAQVARSGASYAHLITAFPGDAQAQRLEARLYATKEWGTARTPAAILHKYVGRAHYVGEDADILGLQVAATLARQPPTGDD